MYEILRKTKLCPSEILIKKIKYAKINHKKKLKYV